MLKKYDQTVCCMVALHVTLKNSCFWHFCWKKSKTIRKFSI